MRTELLYLTLVSVLTAVLWIPYVLDRFRVRGVADTVGYPTDPKPEAPWARRLMRAHANAVENLVVFAALVLTAQAAGISSDAVASASILYFWARLVHAVVYALGVPWVRTLAFVAGFVAQLIVAWEILVA